MAFLTLSEQLEFGVANVTSNDCCNFQDNFNQPGVKLEEVDMQQGSEGI